MKKRFMRISLKIKSFFKKSRQRSDEQAVLIHLDGVGLTRQIYENHDLATLEDQLIEALQKKDVGELDGNEIGEGGATIFIYGSNAEKIFSEVDAVLRSYPLCQNARVVIRYGAPGASQREVRIS